MPSRKLRVLHVIHDFLPRHRAGSEIYAYRLAKTLGEHHDVSLWCAEYEPSQPHGTLHRRMYEGLKVFETVNNWRFGSFEQTYRAHSMQAPLRETLQEVRPDIVHVHNLLNSTFDLPRLAKEAGAPCVFTLHDYTLVCPSGGQRVHLAEEHLCQRIEPSRCSRCFRQSAFHSQMSFGAVAGVPSVMGPAAAVGRWLRPRFPRAVEQMEAGLRRWGGAGVGPRDIQKRLDAASEVFQEGALFVAPSPSLGNEYRALGLPAEKLEISDYGFPSLPSVSREASDGRLRIGFVGTLAWHKGAHVLLDAVRSLPPERFVVRLFGDPRTFPAYSDSLRVLARDLPVEFAGPFKESDAAGVYARLDTLVVPSLWLENSPLVIHEAFQAGVPVVGAKHGGIVDLVRDGESGLLYDGYRPSELSACLARLLEEEGLLERLRSRLPAVKSVETDAAEWEARYERVLRRRTVRAAS